MGWMFRALLRDRSRQTAGKGVMNRDKREACGHDVGDDVLWLLASLLRKMGGGSKAFRYGGEEFTLLFPGKTLKEALPHLEQLRKRVAERTFHVRNYPRKGKEYRGKGGAGKTETITISVGAAGGSSGEDEPDAVLKEVDQALYRAKEGGRNRISRASR